MRMFHNSFFPVGEPSWSRCNLPGEIAGETRSDARMASEGPRATIKKRPLTVGRGTGPRQRSRARPCRAGSPADPDPFVIRRSQTTEGETHIVTMEIAGDRPPRYGEKTPPLHVGRGPVPRQRPRTPTIAGDRPPRYGEIETGRSLLPGRHRDQEVSPTGLKSIKKRQRILKIRCPRKRNSRKLTLYLL